MKSFTLVALLFLFSLSTTVTSQTTAIEKTDVNKDIDLMRVYEQYVKDGYGTPAVYKKLADGYYFKNDYTTAKKWLEELLQADASTPKMYINRYIQTLRALDIDTTNNKYLTFQKRNL
jgi:Tfp pilus assembly protein PilF